MYILQTRRHAYSNTDKPAVKPPVEDTSPESVYLAYLNYVHKDSKLDLRVGMTSAKNILSAIMNVNDFTLKFTECAIDTVKIIKEFASQHKDKNIVIYTDGHVSTFDALKRISNVFPVRYGNILYDYALQIPVDYIILLPQKKSNRIFGNIVTIAHDLHNCQEYIPINDINFISLSAGLDMYKDEYDTYVNNSNGKITIKNKDGEDSIIEIK